MLLPESFASTCCSVIRERRLKLGLSQEEVAKRSGLARSYICDVERGSRHPSLRNVANLASALEIKTSELITLVELHLAIQIDLAALKANSLESGLHTEIINYFNDRVSSGIVIADRDGFLFFNSAAEKLTGIGRVDIPMENWSDTYGCYEKNKQTKIPSKELPLIKAIEGESLDDINVFLKNDSTPEGRCLSVSARPVKMATGRPVAGVVIFREVVF